MNIRAALSIIFVFIGCCSNVVFLELIIKDEPASGSLVTFLQFVFIALHGFISTMAFGKKKNVIPIKEYLIIVVLFFIVNVTNNIAFGYKISMPLHIIFRSGGLIATLLMGMIVLGKRYTPSKYISVLMITFGTVISTLASAESIISESKEGAPSNFSTWVMGIFLLTVALFLQARMGIFQECLYVKHGKHPKEALFFIHAFCLPGFLVTSKSIYEHVIKFNASQPLQQLMIPGVSAVPRLWLYALGNTLTQFICISSVFTLTSECSALTVTLVLTLRKFLSLVFSILYFQNPFTLYHWAGAFLVFGGTLIFSELFTKSCMQTEDTSKKDE